MTSTAIVLAAGAGTRLGALGRECSKAMLPVAGEPLVHWCIERLQAAGLGRIVVVAHAGDARLAAFLRARHADVLVAVQTERRGTADAIRCALPHVATEPAYLACACDSLFSAADIARVAERGRMRPGDAAVGVLDMGLEATTTRSAVRVEEERVVALVEKPTSAAPGSVVAAPLYWLPAAVTPFVVEVRPIAGERYLTTALDDWIRHGGIVWAVPLGGRIEVTTAEDARRADLALRSS